jgi:hypothetical protein
MRLSEEEIEWTRNAAQKLYMELGTWQRVADALAAPQLGRSRLHRSPSSWFQIVQKGRVNRPKANALRAYHGLPLYETSRTAIPVTRISRDRLRSDKQPGENWDAFLMRLLEQSAH